MSMRKVTFILPCVGRRAAREPYPRAWLMEPLAIAQLAALTPPGWEKVFYDDRLEAIPYDEPTGLVALSVETYTARRAGQISARFRARGVPVVMGGFHPTLAPDDAAPDADALVLGQAEGVWAGLLEDCAAGRLQPRYEAPQPPDLSGIFPDRTIFAGKRYMNLALVETGRGCRLACDFCSISAFFRRGHTARPVADVAREVAALRGRPVFFVDDNLAVDRVRARVLFEALRPLGVRWIGQISVHAADDDAFLAAMQASGCAGVLIGFESLAPASPALRGKALPGSPRPAYEAAIASLNRHGIAVYGTFVFGYDADTAATVAEAADFALRQRLFFAAFNHLVPFPGTPLYRRLAGEGRLIRAAWWREPDYRFGDLAFQPAGLTAPELAEACYRARRAFYALPRILARARNRRGNGSSLFMAWIYLTSNLLSRGEVEKRQGLPLGIENEE